MVRVWLATQASGIHATIAGVALGLFAPARALTPGRVARQWAGDLADAPSPAELAAMTRLARTAVSPAERLEDLLHPCTTFVVVPLFALANAGVSVRADSFVAPGAVTVAAGVMVGLVVGKAVGITAAAWLAARSGGGEAPEGATWPMVAGIATVKPGTETASSVSKLPSMSTRMVEPGSTHLSSSVTILGAIGFHPTISRRLGFAPLIAELGAGSGVRGGSARGSMASRCDRRRRECRRRRRRGRPAGSGKPDQLTQMWVLLLCAATAGFGGGNFSSSMFNISFFYPERKKGFALGLNAAGGNLGVAVAQLFVPLVIIIGVPTAAVKLPKHGIHMAYAGLMWISLVVIGSLLAWRYMDSLTQAKADKGAYMQALRSGQTWVMSFLYIGTFGSFIGFSFALPLVIKTTFPESLAGHPFIATYLAGLGFVGALIGSVSRPLGGWLADRWGGSRVTLAMFAGMIAFTATAIVGVQQRSFPCSSPRTW